LKAQVKGFDGLEHDLDPQKTRSIIGPDLSKLFGREAKLAGMNYALEVALRTFSSAEDHVWMRFKARCTQVRADITA
jgi:hypothetical protein